MHGGRGREAGVPDGGGRVGVNDAHEGTDGVDVKPFQASELCIDLPYSESI